MDRALGPPEKMAERREDLTPMMAQYFELCAQYDQALVLFQVGDFYEAFCEAAEVVARRCEITLTQREDSTGEYAMAGIPIDNAESYIDRLLDAGYRVAVADQVQEPEETTGVVDRAVTRIITPGTLTEDELLDGERNNYLAAVAAGERIGCAVLDISTGDFYATSANDPETVADELGRFDPAEVIAGPDVPAELVEGYTVSPFEEEAFGIERARETVADYFQAPDRLLASDAEISACGAVLAYAEYARGGTEDRLDYLNHLTRYDPREYMLLDAVAIESLELFERRTVHGHGEATLSGVVDETASALGRRELDEWLRRPLIDPDEIAARHDAVGELRDDVRTREQVHEQLRDIYDIERLVSRIGRGRANARDLRSLKATLDVIPRVRELLDDPECEKLRSVRERLDPLADVRTLIDDAIREDPDREITEGGIINPSFDEELAELRETERAGKEWIESLEASERERTGIDSLKVGHNSVHGYYIEVTDANLDRVPEDYERRQTLKNAERYYTPELKAREDEIIRAEARADDLEYELFSEVRSTVADRSADLQALAAVLAELDVLVSFATVAAEHEYSRPVVVGPDDPAVDGIYVEDGRHPVVEQTQSSFVPNDTRLSSDERVAVITGPNMSGKSTYMRQVALIVILAQAGGFVPAKQARIELVDRIFTRVGASDDIAGGRSTFMVEMTELADILDHATEQSLVLLDEVGRGTSTADGFAIAQAVTEFLHDEVGALTLFATHHHDLTAVAAELEAATNRYFETTQTAEGVVFEHDLLTGTADASYGVEVAATAGIEQAVVDRAREVLADDTPDARPAGDRTNGQANPDDPTEPDAGLGASRPGSESGTRQQAAPESEGGAVAEEIRDADVATMTPLEAMNLLASLQRRLESRD
ncbi:DNA mismatch repair protein MutS [Halovenus sp. WSH3]|uniref:DNA mismatch repair protein MutS n=1 Tax=Halovenus carboxidivorans TaxID=2692199 RepID=A0A6B0T8X9_9EURY|nr:DNA mismatch repair protein MutS [Halovenus carboxidivorans]MXR51320.1 DNA mismatch repair protein MutS [Halovenus carboxidivorans]